jgi:hypothetical protein
MCLHTFRGTKAEVMCIAFMKYIDIVISSLSLLKVQLAAMFWLRTMYFIPILYLVLNMSL